MTSALVLAFLCGVIGFVAMALVAYAHHRLTEK